MIIAFHDLKERIEARLKRALASGVTPSKTYAGIEAVMVGRKTAIGVGMCSDHVQDKWVNARCYVYGTTVDPSTIKIDWTEANERELFQKFFGVNQKKRHAKPVPEEPLMDRLLAENYKFARGVLRQVLSFANSTTGHGAEFIYDKTLTEPKIVIGMKWVTKWSRGHASRYRSYSVTVTGPLTSYRGATPNKKQVLWLGPCNRCWVVYNCNSHRLPWAYDGYLVNNHFAKTLGEAMNGAYDDSIKSRRR